MSIEYNDEEDNEDKDLMLVPPDWVTTILMVVLWLIVVFSFYVMFLMLPKP